MKRMKKNYKGLIIQFLNKATAPMNVEQVRTVCGIRSRNAALKLCLELLTEGKIKGQKTSKGWIFWIHKSIQLKPWQEAVGTFKELKITKENIKVILKISKDLTITIPKTPHTEQTVQTLQKIPKGTKIAILHTSNPQKPIMIRTFNETAVSTKNFLSKPWFRKRASLVAFMMVALKKALFTMPEWRL